MAEPLGIAASVLGVTVPALHGARLLLDDLQSIRDAPEAVERLEGELKSLIVALTALQNVEDREWEVLGTTVAEQSKMTISSCKQACDLFRPKLKQWTRHSNGKLGLQDRLSVGFMKKGQLKAMSEQLQNCKLSINSTVGVATLYSSIRHTHMTEEIQKTIATRQTEIKGGITTADRQLIILENKLEELELSEEDEAGTEDAKRRADTLGQLQEEQKALNASRKLLEELLSKAQEEAIAKAAAEKTGHPMNIRFGNNNSGFQAGNIGTVSGLTFGGRQT